MNRMIKCLGAISVAFSSLALGQTRVRDGHALDANNMIGSGGLNTPVNARPWNPALGYSTLSGNQIVTGNVTGLGYFHGNIAYSDSHEFHGRSSANYSNHLIARSSPAPAPYQAARHALQPQVYYAADKLAGAPPPGLVRRDTAYTSMPETYLDTKQYTGIPVDLRKMGKLDAPGRIDTETSLPSMLDSLLRESGNSGEADQLQDSLPSSNIEQNLRRLGIDPQGLQRMRLEAHENHTSVETGGLGSPSLTHNPGGTPLPGIVRPSGGMSSRLVRPDAIQARQSLLYAQMQEKLDSYYGGVLEAMKDERQNQRLVRQLQELQDQKLHKGDPTATSQDLRGQISRQLAVQPAPASVRPQPLRVESLSAGISAEGLRSVLTKAEALMKEGRFISALDQYELASEIAPENRLFVLGKANTELGAGLYHRAARHLVEAMSSDPVVTMAKFDLAKAFGPERLHTVVSDLKQVAAREKANPVPLLLLAYLAYNSGDEASVSGYLDQAQQRSRSDALVKLLKSHWALPGLPQGPTTRPAH